MRLWLLLFVFVAAGYESVLQWRKTGDELGFMSAQAGDGSGPVVGSQPGTAARPSASPPALSSQQAIQAQERLLAETQKKADELKSRLDAIDKQRDGLERASAAYDSGKLSRALADLAALESEKQAAVREEILRKADERTRQETRRLSAEIQAAQLRDQLSREQSLLAQLNDRLRTIQSSNIDTDELRSAQRASVSQAQRISELQARYRDVQFEYARQEAADAAHLSEQVPSATDMLDAQVQRQREVVSQAQREQDESARRQQAGIASSSALDDRATETRREYNETLSALDGQRQALARMKSASAR